MIFLQKNECIQDIFGAEGRYFITSFGRVFSIKKHKFSSTRIIILSSRDDKDGYRYVNIYMNNKIRKTKKIHRLVAETFISNDGLLLQINHKDGIKHNNFMDNLEWCTNQYNATHRDQSGLSSRGTRHEDSLSKYVGVSENKRCTIKKWYARIVINNKRISLGYYATQEEAALAYNKGSLKYHGKTGKINKIK